MVRLLLKKVLNDMTSKMKKEGGKVYITPSKKVGDTIKEEVDPPDVDITTTDKDVENKSKNIILQLRKVITLRGIKPVVFISGKEKVNPKYYWKTLSIHQSLRRTDEKDHSKEKLQSHIKTYSMLIKEIINEIYLL